jgi:DNA-binding NtrC family response regulator
LRVLFVDQDEALRAQWVDVFERADHTVAFVDSVGSARNLLITRSCDVAVIELCLPDESGLVAAALAKCANPACCVILITGSGLFPHGEVYDIAPSVTIMLRKPVQTLELLAVAEYYYGRTSEGRLVCGGEGLPRNKRGGDTREEEGAAA